MTRATARASSHAPETQEYLIHAATQAPATIPRAFTSATPPGLKCPMHMCMSADSLRGGKSPLKQYLENDDVMKHRCNTTSNDVRLLLKSNPTCNCVSNQNRTSLSMPSDGCPRCKRQIKSNIGLPTNSFPTTSQRQSTSKTLHRKAKKSINYVTLRPSKNKTQILVNTSKGTQGRHIQSNGQQARLWQIPEGRHVAGNDKLPVMESCGFSRTTTETNTDKTRLA